MLLQTHLVPYNSDRQDEYIVKSTGKKRYRAYFLIS